jgi:hypothetical protein
MLVPALLMPLVLPLLLPFPPPPPCCPNPNTAQSAAPHLWQVAADGVGQLVAAQRGIQPPGFGPLSPPPPFLSCSSLSNPLMSAPCTLYPPQQNQHASLHPPPHP